VCTGTPVTMSKQSGDQWPGPTVEVLFPHRGRHHRLRRVDTPTATATAAAAAGAAGNRTGAADAGDAMTPLPRCPRRPFPHRRHVPTRVVHINEHHERRRAYLHLLSLRCPRQIFQAATRALLRAFCQEYCEFIFSGDDGGTLGYSLPLPLLLARRGVTSKAPRVDEERTRADKARASGK